MLSKLRARLTYANVVASLALFLALTGGTAVALSGTNTVFSDDIVDREVRSQDIAVETISGGHVKPDSLTGTRIKDLTGDDMADFKVGMRSVTIPSGGTGTVSATCPEGTTVVSGGAWFDRTSGRLSASHVDTLTTWRGAGQNEGSAPNDLHALVYCH